jgi:hypothetical protein
LPTARLKANNTVTWHVDDLNHVDPKDEFLTWLEKMYGDNDIRKVKATRGTRHDYVGMTLDYSKSGQIKVDMTDYIESISGIRTYPEDVGERSATTPWYESLFKVSEKSKRITSELQEKFHTIMAKGLFVTKRARQDMQPGIANLCTRIQNPTEDDWKKLRRKIQC